jgi:tRNA(adenine34) deaminase
MQLDDQHWMQHALTLAREAEQVGEVPIGAVLVDNATQSVIGSGFNSVITAHDPTAHAEVMALRAAGQSRQNYRLIDSTLYVTLEPCPMCAMAMVHARISKLVYAASDPKLGCFSREHDFLRHANINHQFEVSAGILAEDASALLKTFFKARRLKT